MLIKCLWAIVDLFDIYPHEMLGIDPIVACHELNNDLNTTMSSTSCTEEEGNL